MLTYAAPDELFNDACPRCAMGLAVRHRADSKEWVHDVGVSMPGATTIQHCICMATHLRNKYQDSPNG